MKKLTTLLLIVASVFMFASCGDNDDSPIKSFMFVGTFNSELPDSEMKDISLQTTFNADNGTCEITLWEIRFAHTQNRLYNFTVKGLKVEANESDTIITGENIIPTFSVASQSVGDLDFVAKKVDATIKNGHISFKATVLKSQNDLDLFFEGDKK